MKKKEGGHRANYPAPAVSCRIGLEREVPLKKGGEKNIRKKLIIGAFLICTSLLIIFVFMHGRFVILKTQKQVQWNTGPLLPDDTNADSAVFTLKMEPGGYRAVISGTGKFCASPNGWGRDLQNMSSGWIAKIREVDIEPGITFIDAGVFSGCNYLEKVSLPASLKEIGILAFAYCEKLNHVMYEGTVHEWEELNAASIGWADESGIFVVLCSDGKVWL